MRKIYYELDIGYVGCGEEGVMEVGDNCTDTEIDDMVYNMAHQHAASWEGDERLDFTSPDDDDYSEELAQEEIDSFYENVDGWWREATPQDIEDYC